MNILTKICIVLLAIGAVIASVIFINQATVPPNWKFYYQQMKAQNENLQDTNRQLQSSLGDLQTRLKSTIDDYSDQVNELKARIDSLQGEKSDLGTKLAQSEKELKTLQSRVNVISLTDQQQLDFIETLEERIASLNDEKIQLLEQRDTCRRELASARNQVEQLQANVKQLRQMNEELNVVLGDRNEKVRKLERLLDEQGVDVELTPRPVTKITGHVTAVDLANGLASVNVGQAHGVEEGMELVVYRGDRYVGKLKIQNVSANDSAGIMSDKRLNPMVGDQITSSLGGD